MRTVGGQAARAWLEAQNCAADFDRIETVVKVLSLPAPYRTGKRWAGSWPQTQRRDNAIISSRKCANHKKTKFCQVGIHFFEFLPLSIALFCLVVALFLDYLNPISLES